MARSSIEDDASLVQRAIVGLGNPGERYAPTRHNVGFRVIEELARRQESRPEAGACQSLLCRRRFEAAECDWLLVAPQTYMNRSGHAVRCLAERYDLEPEAFLVVYDEIHLPLGKLRLRRGGSPAGHRGMESVLESLGSAKVARLRLGVAPRDGAPDGEDLVAFVLSSFEGEEEKEVGEMIVRAADACETWALHGAETAMQKYNG